MSERVSEDIIQKLKRLHSEGKTSSEIAAATGLHKSTVNRYSREMGLPIIKSQHCRKQKKAPAPVNKTAQAGMCDSYCDGCVHLTEVSLNTRMRACYYIVDTGRKRPCPAGTGCTVKSGGKREPKLIDI